MSNPMTSEQFVRLLDTRLRKVDEGMFGDIPSMLDQFFTMLPSDSAFEEFYELGSLPDIGEHNGKIEYLNIVPEYYKKIEPKEYSGGVMFDRKLVDDKKYKVMDNRAGMLAQSAARVREKEGVKFLTDAFSNAFSFMTSEEGLSLCNSSHTTNSGVSTSSGFDNAGTSAASATSVAATRLAMMRFRNNIGDLTPVNPDMIICPVALEDKFLEINGTEKGLYSGEGTKNVQAGRFKIVAHPRLDESSTKNWYMVDSAMMKKFLVWIDRVKAEYNTTVDFQTLIIMHSVYARWGWGFLNWRWIYGHQVS